MTSKTAMQQAIELIETAIAYNVEGCHKTKPYTWTELSNDLNELLATEKQQHIETFNAGTKARYIKGAKEMGLETLPEGIETGEQYFTKTFGQ